MKCASCDIDLTGIQPVLVGGMPFCCRGCAEGGPCICSYEEEHLRLSRLALGWQVQVRELLNHYEKAESLQRVGKGPGHV